MNSASRRVLVVEDDPVINQAVSDRLAAEGYDVARAWDGPGALAAYDDHSPELVVLDVMLPGFDGHEVCRRIQADRPVPVLMLTARADETDVLVGPGVGADDYLTTPFRMGELFEDRSGSSPSTTAAPPRPGLHVAGRPGVVAGAGAQVGA